MSKAFVFKQPQMTVTNETTSTDTVIGDENFAEDGITLTIESSPREISRFNGTDRLSSSTKDVTATVATILEQGDIWKLFSVFKIAGIETVTLANGKTGVKIGGTGVCSSTDKLSVIIEDKCRDEADVHARIKLTDVEFDTESLELAMNNSDGITPEFAMYCNADANGVKALLGFDDASV